MKMRMTVTGKESRAIHEIARIDSLVRLLPRSPRQLNGVHESDAELIRIPGLRGILAVTTDAIVEEISSGLYDDPYLIGWMAVTASASDLAAVGADPVGILILETIPRDIDPESLAALQAGIRDACEACGVAGAAGGCGAPYSSGTGGTAGIFGSAVHAMPVLGGDTSVGTTIGAAGCAIGLIPEGEPLMRISCSPGDVLFVTGSLGAGSAYAFQRFSGGGSPPASEADPARWFRPRARIAEGRIARRFASACIDTSDGLLPACGEIARLNGCGVLIEADTSEILDPHAREVAACAGIPPWSLLAGPHGEFELLLAVPPGECAGIEENGSFVRIGRVIPEPVVRMRDRDGGGAHEIDTVRLRNLEFEPGRGLASFLADVLSCRSPHAGEA